MPRARGRPSRTCAMCTHGLSRTRTGMYARKVRARTRGYNLSHMHTARTEATCVHVRCAVLVRTHIPIMPYALGASVLLASTHRGAATSALRSVHRAPSMGRGGGVKYCYASLLHTAYRSCTRLNASYVLAVSHQESMTSLYGFLPLMRDMVHEKASTASWSVRLCPGRLS